MSEGDVKAAFPTPCARLFSKAWESATGKELTSPSTSDSNWKPLVSALSHPF